MSNINIDDVDFICINSLQLAFKRYKRGEQLLPEHKEAMLRLQNPEKFFSPSRYAMGDIKRAVLRDLAYNEENERKLRARDTQVQKKMARTMTTEDEPKPPENIDFATAKPSDFTNDDRKYIAQELKNQFGHNLENSWVTYKLDDLIETGRKLAMEPAEVGQNEFPDHVR